MPEKKKIGLIAGVFDLVHAGHVLALMEARDWCDYLIVALHVAPTDPSKHRPVMSVYERMTILGAIRYVDQIVCYVNEYELWEFLNDLEVDIRFLGEDWRGRLITGGDLPIEVRYLSRSHGFSTSELRARICAAEAARKNPLIMSFEQSASDFRNAVR